MTATTGTDDQTEGDDLSDEQIDAINATVQSVAKATSQKRTLPERNNVLQSQGN